MILLKTKRMKMNTYEVYIQGSSMGTIQAENTGQVFPIIDAKIKSGEYSVDSLEPLNIEIKTVNS